MYDNDERPESAVPVTYLGQAVPETASKTKHAKSNIDLAPKTKQNAKQKNNTKPKQKSDQKYSRKFRNSSVDCWVDI